MSESGQPIQRATFTDAQLLQAKFVGEVTDAHRMARRQIPTYPIDNVDPEVVSDRDDGVFVEAEHRDGGYRVHVTIADVAAHIHHNSPLAQAIAKRGFTLYGPGWTDPMVPNGPEQRLEEKMSLEHNRERLGLTVSITLNKNFRPVHTSFTPVITHPDNSSYSQAHERMQRDPQFQLMREISQGIKKHHFQGRELHLDETFSQRTLRRLQNHPEQLEAMEMVATYMLLANNCTAEFAYKANLPFLYRIFGTDDSHALYSTFAGPHVAVNQMGIEGKYCHFTSPIRRAPDYFNAIMIHYVIETLGMVEQRVRAQYPSVNPKELNDRLWQYGPQLMDLFSTMPYGTVRQRASLQRLLSEIVQPSMPSSQPWSEAGLRTVVSNLTIKAPPLTREQMQTFGEFSNNLARSPEVRAVERQNEKYERSIERIETVQFTEKESLAGKTREQFSSLLDAAALTGNIPRNLFEEARARIQSGNFDMGRDGFTIFIVAAHPGVSRWKVLKGLIATQLKSDPSAVNGMLKKLQLQVAPAIIEEVPFIARRKTSDKNPDEQARVPAGFLKMSGPDMPTLTPPFPSVGDDRRAWLSHACYYFLEHYAFGQLQPIEQMAMSSSRYADLLKDHVEKGELLENLARDIGATVRYRESETHTGRIIQTITVHGGELAEPITVEADEATASEARETAIRRLLRNETFKLAVSYEEMIANELVNPQSLLKEMVEERGGSVEFVRHPRANGPHRAYANITFDGKTTTIGEEGPNLDRAERNAALSALHEMGWQTDELAPGMGMQSWVTEHQRPPVGEGRQYHAK